MTPTQIEEMGQQIVDTHQLVRYQSEVETQKRFRLQQEGDCRLRAATAGRPLPPPGRLRLPGGGRKTLIETQPELLPALYKMLPQSTQEVVSPLQWTTITAKELAAHLINEGFQVSQSSIPSLLHRAGLRAHATVRIPMNRPSPGDNQFDFVNSLSMEALRHEQRVFFIDFHVEPDTDTPEMVAPDKAYEHRCQQVADCIVNAVRFQWYDPKGKDKSPMVVLEGGTLLGITNDYLHSRLEELANSKCCNILLCYFPSGISRWTHPKRVFEKPYFISNTKQTSDTCFITVDEIYTEMKLPYIIGDTPLLMRQFHSESKESKLCAWNRILGTATYLKKPKKVEK